MAEWRGDGEPAGSSRSGATGAAETTERSEVNPTSSASNLWRLAFRAFQDSKPIPDRKFEAINLIVPKNATMSDSAPEHV